MITAIQQIPDWHTLSATQIHAILAADTREIRDDTPVTIAEIVDALDEQSGLLVLGTIKQAAVSDPRVDSAWIALSTIGMRLDTPERQVMIDSLADAGNWPQAVHDTVHDLRVRIESVWPEITVPDVQSSLNQIAEQTRSDAIDALKSRIENEIIFPAMTDGISTVADVIAALHEVV